VERRQPPLDLLGGDRGMTPGTLRGYAAALAAALLLLAATGCTGGGDEPAAAPSTSAAPTPTPTAAPPPEPPAVDTCYRLNYDDAVAPSNAEAAVPCQKPHTSQTYAVGRLDLVSGGHLLAVDSDAAKAQVAKRCPRQLAAYVGATPEQLRLSQLQAIWFTPTVEEGDDGAAWYRCDLVAATGDGRLAKIGEPLAGAFAKADVRAAYSRCGTAQPGSAGFTPVLCREEHTWKAISVVDLSDRGRAYPGEKAVRQAGEQDDVCADAARDVAADALDFEWGYEWPTAEQWAAGQTYGRCWAPD
jgi:hypothetical protein